jgi:periplasmic protein TonB
MTAGRAESFRWAGCFALALCFHGAGAAALLAKWNESSDLVANAPLIMIDLAPVAVAPETVPNDVPPDQVASRPEPEPEPEPEKPVEKIELPPPQVQPEVTLPPPPPKVVEKPKEKKPEKKKMVARTPSAAPQRADHAAAPMPGASGDSNAMPNWRSQLVSRLERYKRYPSEAQSRGEAGVAQLAFSIDRSGGVHNARIVRSSGSTLLDRETLALVERAQPLPPPPPEASGSQIAVVVPIRYNAR